MHTQTHLLTEAIHTAALKHQRANNICNCMASNNLFSSNLSSYTLLQSHLIIIISAYIFLTTQTNRRTRLITQLYSIMDNKKSNEIHENLIAMKFSNHTVQC